MAWNGGSTLSELSLLINFNPASAPYLGASDIDVLDSYTGEINGLVYASGNVLISSTCAVNGVVVAGGTASVTAVTNLTYGSTFTVTPPPGFAGGNVMRVIPRTWKRDVR